MRKLLLAVAVAVFALVLTDGILWTTSLQPRTIARIAVFVFGVTLVCAHDWLRRRKP